MGDDFPVDELTDEVEIIFEGEDDESEAEQPDEELPSGEEAEVSDQAVQLRAEIAELRESYLRKLAEFDNFRKRTEREKAELRRTAGEDVVRDLVPVLDNFERALVHSREPNGDLAGFRLGVEMIAKQLLETLERQGMEIVDPQGETFDPELHEALQRIEDTDQEPGTVVSVLAKGYRFGGKLLRPAMVGVAVEASPVARPAAPEPEVEATEAEREGESTQ